MDNQKLLSSVINDIPESQLRLPEKWQEKYLIKRIGEEDIEITLLQRNIILKTLQQGVRFVQIGRYTLMLNSIKSIDPKWGKDNIPPRPEKKITHEEVREPNGKYTTYKVKEIVDSSEQREWDKYFGRLKALKLATK